MTYTEEKENRTGIDDDVLEEYYTGEELSGLETHVLAGKVEEKIEKNKSRLSFINHLRALGEYLFDGNVKWYRKSVVVAALVYFITPVDAIPDFAPIAGFLDDLGVITATVTFLGNELKKYYG